MKVYIYDVINERVSLNQKKTLLQDEFACEILWGFNINGKIVETHSCLKQKEQQ